MNSKSYNLFIKNLRTFSLAIANFATGVGLRVSIKNLFIRFVTQLSMLMNAITFQKIKLKIISITSLSTLLSTSIIKISPKLNMISSALINLVTNINIINPLHVILSAIQSVATIIHTDKIKLNATALLGQFYTIGHYDSFTIGSMDSATLGDLDFLAT